MSVTTEPIHVLHVDDDPEFAELAATFVERERERFVVDTETSADEGLERLAESRFDCVVSDYDMPGRNGIEFLQVVRERDEELPFILYTGKGSEEIASEAISAGVTDYLQKGGGTSQYAVLANRIANAVEQYRSKRRIEESQKRLSLFFDQSPLGVVEWNESFEFTRLSGTAEAILGYDEADLLGRSWEVIVPESDREPVGEVVSGLLTAEGGYHSVNENVTADGERIVCEWHNRVVTDDDGSVVAIFSQFRDITDRVERERELQQYEAYLEESTDIITVLDGDGTIEYQSPAVTRILGYEPGELIDENGFEYIHPDDVDDLQATFADLVSKPGATVTVECRFRTADGEWRWLEVRGTNQLEHDAIGGIVTNNRDITARKESERSLLEERTFVEQSLDVLQDVFFVFDTDGKLLRWNDRLPETTGYSEEEVSGMGPAEFFSPDHRDRIADAARNALETGTVTVSADVRTSDGERIPYELNGARLTDADGEVVGFAGVGRDVSERRERERELVRTRDLLERTERIADVGGWEIDTGTMEMFWTDHLFDVLGVDRDEEPPLAEALEVYHEDDRAAVEDAVQRALDTGEPFDVEARSRRSGGGTRWFRVYGMPTVEDGDVVTLRGAVQDVTERKRIERELRQESDLVSGIVETSPVGITVVDADGNVTFANERAETIYGRPREEVSGFSHDDARWDLLDEGGEPFEAGETPFERVVSGEGPVREQVVGLRRPSGERVWVSVNGAPQWDEDGGLERAVFAFEDVTERRELEAELEEILDRVADAFFALDDEFRFTHVNDRAEELLRASEEELLGESLWDLYAEATDIEEVWEAFNAAMDTQEPQSYEVYYDPLDFWVQATVYPSESGVSVYFRDITDRKEYERELERQNERLAEFASFVSHDLRNPLNVAQGRLDLAREEGTDDDEHLDAVARAHERMSALVSDLLALARDGAAASDSEPVDLAATARRCWETVETADASLNVDVDRTVRGDASRLKQVFENLFRNAVEHGGPGVAVTVGELDDGFYVEDDGPGVPVDDREDVFDAGHSTSERGTGFGLSIVRQTVETHGWTVRLTEGADGGARFEITGVAFVAE
jgi:PAS domain S-box-containing protein